MLCTLIKTAHLLYDLATWQQTGANSDCRLQLQASLTAIRFGLRWHRSWPFSDCNIANLGNPCRHMSFAHAPCIRLWPLTSTICCRAALGWPSFIAAFICLPWLICSAAFVDTQLLLLLYSIGAQLEYSPSCMLGNDL